MKEYMNNRPLWIIVSTTFLLLFFTVTASLMYVKSPTRAEYTFKTTSNSIVPKAKSQPASPLPPLPVREITSDNETESDLIGLYSSVIADKGDEKSGNYELKTIEPEAQSIEDVIQPKTKPKAKPVTVAVKKKVAAPQQKKVNTYWIQTGSYKEESRAKLAAEDLEQYNIHALIQPFASSDNQKYYRVRIGGFLSKDEATGFLTKVQQIQGLDQSTIIQSATYRS